MSEIDYDAVKVPEDTPPEEYGYAARRAEILQMLKEAGHPSRLNQTQLAGRYGCAQSTVSKDMTRLGEYVENNVGSDRALLTEHVFNRAITGLLEEEEWRDAARTVKEYNDWITEYKDINEIKERLDALEAANNDAAGVTITEL